MQQGSTSAVARARLVALILAGAAWGCGDSGSTARAEEVPRPEAAGAAPEEIVATVAGEPISLGAVDEAAGGELASLQQKIYEVRRRILDDMVRQRLFEREAARRGVTVDELLAEEIQERLPEITEQAIDDFYEQIKRRVGGRSKQELLPQLHGELHRRAVAEREEAFADELARAADVKLLLPPPRAEVSVPEDAPSLGAEDAEVTIVAFSDYQCPYCHRAQETVEELLERYSGRVRLVHRDFPLNIHPGAVPAARAARCAGEQDRFWDYHRGLLSRMSDYSEEDLKQRAAQLDLEVDAFAQCLASGRHEDAVEAGFEQGRRLGVTATPTFFINGRRLEGARPIDDFAAVIDEELALSAG